MSVQHDHLIEYVEEAETNFITNRFDDAGSEFNLIASKLGRSIDGFYFRYRAIQAFSKSDNQIKLIKSIQLLGQQAYSLAIYQCENVLRNSVELKDKEIALFDAIHISKIMGKYDNVEALMETLEQVYLDLFHDEKISFDQKLDYMDRNVELSEMFLNYEKMNNARKRVCFAVFDEFNRNKQYYLQNPNYHYLFANHLLKAISLALQIPDLELVRKLHEQLLTFESILDELPFKKFNLPSLRSNSELEVLIDTQSISGEYLPGDNIILDLDNICKYVGLETIVPVKIIESIINPQTHVLISEFAWDKFDKPFYLEHLRLNKQLTIVKQSQAYTSILQKLAIATQAQVITNRSIKDLQNGLIPFVVKDDAVILSK